MAEVAGQTRKVRILYTAETNCCTFLKQKPIEGMAEDTERGKKSPRRPYAIQAKITKLLLWSETYIMAV